MKLTEHYIPPPLSIIVKTVLSLSPNVLTYKTESFKCFGGQRSLKGRPFNDLS